MEDSSDVMSRAAAGLTMARTPNGRSVWGDKFDANRSDFRLDLAWRLFGDGFHVPSALCHTLLASSRRMRRRWAPHEGFCPCYPFKEELLCGIARRRGP
jgi:hypothetical protein